MLDVIAAGVTVLLMLYIISMSTYPRRGSNYSPPPVGRARRPPPPPAPPRKR